MPGRPPPGATLAPGAAGGCRPAGERRSATCAPGASGRAARATGDGKRLAAGSGGATVGDRFRRRPAPPPGSGARPRRQPGPRRRGRPWRRGETPPGRFRGPRFASPIGSVAGAIGSRGSPAETEGSAASHPRSSQTGNRPAALERAAVRLRPAGPTARPHRAGSPGAGVVHSPSGPRAIGASWPGRATDCGRRRPRAVRIAHGPFIRGIRPRAGTPFWPRMPRGGGGLERRRPPSPPRPRPPPAAP